MTDIAIAVTLSVLIFTLGSCTKRLLHLQYLTSKDKRHIEACRVLDCLGPAKPAKLEKE